MGESVLFAFWHGLGDNIMAIPAIRQYKLAHPDRKIGWAVRRDIDAAGLMEECPYIDRVHSVYSDPWRSPSENRYIKGRVYLLRTFFMKLGTKRLAARFGYDEHRIITTTPEMSLKRDYRSYRYHKIFRIASEMGVELDDLSTEVYIGPEARKRAKKWLAGAERPRVFVHREASILRKNIPVDRAAELLKDIPHSTVIECGTRAEIPGSLHLDLTDIRRNVAVIDECDHALCIDSANMHIAGALRKPLTAVFMTTPIHQALPLHYDVKVVCDDGEFNSIWRDAKKDIRRLYGGSTAD